MTRVWLAGACAFLMSVEAGCATVAKSRVDAAAAQRQAAAEAECRAVAARAAQLGDEAEALQNGLLLGVYLVLRGASEGAWWGVVTGAGAGDGAWIGAAVGAGIGTIIGLAEGIKKGVDARGRYRASYESCLTAR